MARRRLLILGWTRLADSLLHELLKSGSRRYEVVGLVGEPPPSSHRPHPPVLGEARDVAQLVREHAIDGVIVAVRERRGSLPLPELLDCWIRGTAIDRAEDFYERLTGRVPIAHLTPGNLIFCGQIAPWKGYDVLARAVAFLVASVTLAISWPLLAAIALAIKLDSRGPVFFVQDRIGMGGRPFRLVKFRTMQEGRSAGSEWVRDNDHRITRIGRWLRKYRLDELPQLWNILRGEMNFVGPRPHPVDNFVTLVAVARNFAECCAEMPYYSLRTKVPPGLTGWAQVRYGYANDLREEMEKLTYDLYYVKNRSMWLDLRILAETVRLVLSGLLSEGAAVDPTWQTIAGDASHSAPRVRTEPVPREEATVPHGTS